MRARRIVVIALAGGIRAADSALDPRYRYMPRVGQELIPRGTLLSHVYNDGWTNHGPALKALATGRWEVVEYESPKMPTGATLIEAARGQGRTTLVIAPPEGRPRLLTGGQTAGLIAVDLSRDPGPFAAGEPAAALYPLRSFDRPIVSTFLEHDGRWPDLTFLVFDDSDIAHQARWSWYAGTIRQADDLIVRVWERLAADGDTDLVVLPIHGRADAGNTKWGFLNHGRDDEGCTCLWLLAMGPDFPASRVVDRRYRLIDVAPTIARLLGIRFRARGRVISELSA